MRFLMSFGLLLALLASAGAATPAKAPYELDGFRSAKFGMTEAEVKAAITKDFALSGDAVHAGENPAERTQLLTIEVPDLLPQGGKASVVYVLGYHSHKLIQITASWAVAADPSLTPEKLLANATALQNLFLSEGYKEGTVVTNAVPASGGLLVFRGADGRGHLTNLLLQGETKKIKDGQQSLSPTQLLLTYSVDPEHPDIMRLQPGQF